MFQSFAKIRRLRFQTMLDLRTVTGPRQSKKVNQLLAMNGLLRVGSNVLVDGAKKLQYSAALPLPSK